MRRDRPKSKLDREEAFVRTTVEKRLSRFGVGPVIAISVLLCAALTGMATYRWPEFCRIPGVPGWLLMVPGVVLVVAGIAMWLVAGYTVMRAYNRDELVTSGVFALCRHPVYGAWITLILPGAALMARSWVMLVAPVVVYGVFKLLIRTEDDYLGKRYGDAYRTYRAKVNEVVPIPRW